ncbi:MerR family transcriptional regulator [Mycobacterium sp. 1165178.9]|nr:MerR family transcriptional regulator [Mycobacterium sp. 1165178.9]
MTVVSETRQQNARPAVWKVGALAELTGLTVRALHHYDHIGLLRPSFRSSSGHRLYTGQDVARLYRICLLRRLGFGLTRIGEVVDDPQWQLRNAVQCHLDDTRRRVAVAASLQARLSRMVASLAAFDDPSTEELFATIEEMTMLDSTVRSTTALLVYDDLAAAHEYLVRVFGLTAGAMQQDDHGRCVHGEVRAGDHVIWLHPSAEDYQSPRTLGAATGMTVINVDDVDAHYRRCCAAGADVIEEPTDQGYGVREWGARDLEGQLWFFHAPLS